LQVATRLDELFTLISAVYAVVLLVDQSTVSHPKAYFQKFLKIYQRLFEPLSVVLELLLDLFLLCEVESDFGET